MIVQEQDVAFVIWGKVGFLLQQRSDIAVLPSCIVDFTEFVYGHAAVPEGEIVDVAL